MGKMLLLKVDDVATCEHDVMTLVAAAFDTPLSRHDVSAHIAT